MKRLLTQTVAVAGLALLSVACGSDEAPKATAGQARGPAPMVQMAVVEEPIAQEFRYEPEGLQDPFMSFIKNVTELDLGSSPLERFELSQLVVSAIIWGTERPHALIVDPAGKGYIVSEGTAIGKNQGRIVSINDNVILVKETYVDFRDRATSKEVEMRLYESQGG